MQYYFLSFLTGYFLGALPFAVWVGRYYGVDVLKEGSANPGATNVRRLAGVFAGRLVFFLDALKGAVAAGLPLYFFPYLASGPLEEPLGYSVCAFLAAILGHSFSIFLHFKGGKGVATSIGGLFILMPACLLIGLCLWGLVFYFFRYVSFASIVLAVSLPISTYLLGLGEIHLYLAIVLAIVVLLRHRSNILRLWRGTESKISK